MNDMQRDLDELGRRLWPRSDVLRPVRVTRGASGGIPEKRDGRPNLLAIVAVVAVVVAILAGPIVLWRLVNRHTGQAVPPPTAKVSPRPFLHHNGQIVMGRNNSLVAIDPATGYQHVILWAPAGDVVASPAYSPDGTKLAYLRGQLGASTGATFDSIWVLDTTSGHDSRLTTCRGCSANDYISWSPDSSHLAFSEIDQRGNLQLHLIDADGTHATQLTDFPAAQNATQPTWSPDGALIAFTFFTVGSRPDQSIAFPTVNIDVIRPDGTGLVALLEAGRQAPYLFPAWSPDGSRVAYLLDPSPPGTDGNFQYQLWLMNPDGSHHRQIFRYPDCCVTDLGGPAWSPDGTRIAAVTAHTLWVMNADGSGPTSLGVISGDRPAW